ncbi:hypothetical protein FRC03_006461 [Tulasnella sp. 419]|nr:hypothetical protein FRC03_006461 [Tulasnella sp. 419]
MFSRFAVTFNLTALAALNESVAIGISAHTYTVHTIHIPPYQQQPRHLTFHIISQCGYQSVTNRSRRVQYEWWWFFAIVFAIDFTISAKHCLSSAYTHIAYPSFHFSSHFRFSNQYRLRPSPLLGTTPLPGNRSYSTHAGGILPPASFLRPTGSNSAGRARGQSITSPASPGGSVVPTSLPLKSTSSPSSERTSALPITMGGLTPGKKLSIGEVRGSDMR